MASTTTNTANEVPIIIGEMGRPESIVMTHLQARFLLGLLSDPDEVEQMIRYLQYDLGDTTEPIEVAPDPIPPPAPTPVPQPIAPPVLPPLNTGTVAERMEAIRVHHEQMAAHKASQQTTPIPPAPIAPQVAPTAPEPTLVPVVAPTAPKVESKPKATKTRTPRRAKTPIVIVDVLAPISGISALPGKPLPSPTATCIVSSPSPTPNVQSGTGVEKIASAAIERETTNDRGMVELRKRAKELGVKGYATKKIQADTLRARVAIAEEKLAAKPVAAPVQPIPAPVPVKPTKSARRLVADFLNVLPDGRELYTAVYDDGSIENELTVNDVAVAA